MEAPKHKSPGLDDTTAKEFLQESSHFKQQASRFN
jgi:hypothetical protein